MNPITRPSALVTGASKGIGKSIAIELAKRGYDLILVARTESLLQALGQEISDKHNVRCVAVRSDLAAADVADQLLNFCVANGFKPSVLVNNAGIGTYGRFAEADLGELMRMNAINIEALTAIIHKFLPILRSHSKAYILNVGSTAAYQPIPRMAMYAGGKTYVRFLSYALRRELRESPVSVTLLSPGGVETDFVKANGTEKIAENNKHFIMRPEKCARIAVNGMFRGKAEVIPGWYNVVAALSSKFSPTAWATYFSGRVFGEK